jgi:hypothetical protein
MTASMRLCAVVTMALALAGCGSPYYSTDAIEAWVVDAETGKPIEGAVVTANWQLVSFGLDSGGRKLRQLEVMETRTDKNGRFHVPGILRPNVTFDQLGEEDPQILIFKSGYQYFRVVSNYPIGRESPGPHRTSWVNGRTVKLEKDNTVGMRRAMFIGSLTTELSSISMSGDSRQIPQMIRALVCERKKLMLIDAKAAMFSIPGETGKEPDCEEKK